MSRSFKKRPFCTDGRRKTTKKSKRFANKAVRQEKDLSNKSFYKKVYCSWNIHDYISRWTWKEAEQEYYENPKWKKMYPTIEEFFNYWSNCYKRK